MSKKVLAGIVGSVVLTSAVYLKTTYQVSRVIDGDTFETTEKQVVRLSGVDAPEVDRCGGLEAKEHLEKLIMHKRLMIKVIFNDKFKRLVSQVYVGNNYINKEMLLAGKGVYSRADVENSKDLLAAADLARSDKVGVYGDSCTQDSNKTRPKCNIKGNINQYTKELVYHYPGCGQYNSTFVQLYLGDQWFCTKEEAEKAGFKKAQLCP